MKSACEVLAGSGGKRVRRGVVMVGTGVGGGVESAMLMLVFREGGQGRRVARAREVHDEGSVNESAGVVELGQRRRRKVNKKMGRIGKEGRCRLHKEKKMHQLLRNVDPSFALTTNNQGTLHNPNHPPSSVNHTGS